jgi:hypothetical protein
MFWSMGLIKIMKIISNIIYSIGIFIVLCLGGLCLFGLNETVNINAMIPLTWREMAFVWLSFGSIPMLLVCMAVYKFNNIKTSVHKKRNFIIIFLPGFICAICMLFIIGVMVIAMMKFILNL